jgi:hypothetical protein
MSRIFRDFEDFKEKIKEKSNNDPKIAAATLLKTFNALLNKKYKEYEINSSANQDYTWADIKIINKMQEIILDLNISLSAQSTYELIWGVYEEMYPEEVCTTLPDESLKDGQVISIPVDECMSNPEQPRTNFDNVNKIAESFKEKGQLQPILVKKDNDLKKYIICDGECRLRAAKIIGWKYINATITKEDVDFLSMAIFQMAQRSNMNPKDWSEAIVKINKRIKETNKFDKYINIIPKDKFDKLDNDPLSFPVEVTELLYRLYGLTRTNVYNLISIQKQPLEIQEMIAKGKQDYIDGKFTVNFDKDDFPAEFRRSMVLAEMKKKAMNLVENKAKDLSNDDVQFLNLFLFAEKSYTNFEKKIKKIDMTKVSERTKLDVKERINNVFLKFNNKLQEI